MRKVSAQQRIAFLERRIARLERDASFTSDVTGLLKRVYNLPKNFVMNLVNALREAFEMLVRPLFKRMKIMDDHLGVLLAIRIARAFSGLITTADDLPQIVSFDAKKPMESIFTGGIAGKSRKSLLRSWLTCTTESNRRGSRSRTFLGTEISAISSTLLLLRGS